MLEKVKTALRIKHNALDSDILDSIAAARIELKRAGVNEALADSDDNALITLAIKTYCLAIYSAVESVRKGYDESFRYQLDNLRKSFREVGQNV